MRLGFWNRLAIVAFVFGSFALPTWYVLSGNMELSELQQSAHKSCVAAAEQRGDVEGRDRCFDALMAGSDRFYGWSEWGNAIAPSMIGLAILYLLVAGIVQTCKWVGRGRVQK